MFELPKIEAKKPNASFDPFKSTFLTEVEELIGNTSKAPYLKARVSADRLGIIMPSDLSSALAIQIAKANGDAKSIKFPAAITADGKFPNEGEMVSINPKAMYERGKDGLLIVTNN